MGRAGPPRAIEAGLDALSFVGARRLVSPTHRSGLACRRWLRGHNLVEVGNFFVTGTPGSRRAAFARKLRRAQRQPGALLHNLVEVEKAERAGGLGVRFTHLGSIYEWSAGWCTAFVPPLYRLCTACTASWGIFLFFNTCPSHATAENRVQSSRVGGAGMVAGEFVTFCHVLSRLVTSGELFYFFEAPIAAQFGKAPVPTVLNI